MTAVQYEQLVDRLSGAEASRTALRPSIVDPSCSMVVPFYESILRWGGARPHPRCLTGQPDLVPLQLLQPQAHQLDETFELLR